jgi:hypothetical protein
LGQIASVLHKESAGLFTWLEENGEVDRLKLLDHLGTVRQAIEGAHHPRWEYVTLIFRLIDLVKANVPEAKLSSRINLTTGEEISSGQELLKMWALLLNFGHVPWTFTAEKALLHVCSTKELAQQFTNVIRPGRLRRYAKALLAHEDIYRIYHAISAARLRNCSAPPENKNVWQNVLQSYCNWRAESPRVGRLAAIFQKLRTIAYMILDPAYTPALVSMDVSEIFSDPRSLASILYYSDEEFDRLTNAIQQHLYDRVYLAPEVSKHAAAVVTQLVNKILHEIQEKGFIAAIEALACGFLQADINNDAKRYRTLLTLPFKLQENIAVIALPECKPITEEKAFIKSPLIRFSVWPYLDGRTKMINAFIAENASPKLVESTFARGMQCMAGMNRRLLEYHQALIPTELVRPMFDRATISYVESVLRDIFEEDVLWSFSNWQGRKKNLSIFATRKAPVMGPIARLAQQLATRSRFASRVSELNSLFDSLKTEPDTGLYAVIVSSTVAIDRSGLTLAEFDGIYVRVSNEQISLSIIEAKDMIRGSASIMRKQLEAATMKLKVRKHWQQKLLQKRRTSAAPPYSRLEFTIAK